MEQSVIHDAAEWIRGLFELNENVSALDKSLKDLSRDTPFFWRTLGGEGVIGAAGSFIIDLGAPTQGKFWVITALNLFSNTADYSPVANLTGASAYISPASDLTSSSLVLVPSLGSTTAPGMQLFGDKTAYQYSNERLLVNVVVSGASGAYANARVKEYATDDVQPRRI